MTEMLEVDLRTQQRALGRHRGGRRARARRRWRPTYWRGTLASTAGVYTGVKRTIEVTLSNGQLIARVEGAAAIDGGESAAAGAANRHVV